ncbi:unnamed protein product [Phyllotreta striolata]|uniref:Uncharacterized protein n=1 Tax=Phyllotreta striolata TaxID=444603 RepID=A0A9N9TJU4_PHYSR|nr:unnamed protein product [Phyllotreta striolata]
MSVPISSKSSWGTVAGLIAEFVIFDVRSSFELKPRYVPCYFSVFRFNGRRCSDCGNKSGNSKCRTGSFSISIFYSLDRSTF